MKKGSGLALLLSAGLWACLGLSACNDEGLAAEGESCAFSADCADGLFCDLQASLPVCVKAGQPRDLSIIHPDAGQDLSLLD